MGDNSLELKVQLTCKMSVLGATTRLNKNPNVECH